jgi:crossover junction endodeoxyribonuclease RusA
VVRGRVIEASKKLKPWRLAIAKAVEAGLPAEHNIILGPVKVEVEFYLPRPATIKQSKRSFPIVPPDVDKLARGLLDGLNQGEDGKANSGRLWADDSIVVELIARKFYADDRNPGAVVRISAI